MYKKDKSVFISTTLSPFPKSLSVYYENQQKISLCSTHKHSFNIIKIDDRLETSAECKEISVETDKEVLIDKDYIIQIKWLSFNCTQLLAVLLHNGFKVYSNEGTELLFSHSFASNENQENSHSSGIAVLNSSIICIGSNIGSIVMLKVDSENKISIDEKSDQIKHKRPITDLVSDFKNRLISSDDIGKIGVWDYISSDNRFEEFVAFEGYNGFSCNCLVLYKHFICAGYGSGHLRVFDIFNKRLICEISAHIKWVTSLDIAPDTGIVLSTSEDSVVRVWQMIEENDSLKVKNIFNDNIANHMLFGGVFLNSKGNVFCVGGYDSSELHCFRFNSL